MRSFYLFEKCKKICQHNLIRYKCNQNNLELGRKNFSSNSESTAMIPVSDFKMMDQAKSEALRVFDRAVSAVLPGVLIREKVRRVDRTLVIDKVEYPIGKYVYLVGFGKAVAGMAYAMEQILGCRLQKGIVSVPKQPFRKAASDEFKDLHAMTEIQLQEIQMLKRSKKIQYLEGASDNRPNEASVSNTKRIVKFMKYVGDKDTLIVLISGGGSALLSLPKESLTVERKCELCVKLQNAGANITELNRVRKQLSLVKAGGLAKLVYPRQVLTLILSDVVGDHIETIASGPTCAFLGENPNEAVEILQKYNLYDSLENEIKEMLVDSEEKILEESEMIEEGKFKHVENIVIGNNTVALEAALQATKWFDLASAILSNTVEGDVSEISYAYAKVARFICYVLEKEFSDESEFVDELFAKNINILNIPREKLKEIFKLLMEMGKGKGVMLLFGGEPTVVVKGDGKGGRNQEIALRFSLDWFGEIAKDPRLAKYFVIFLSAGTDGQDGPTDATGAFGEPSLRPKMIKIHREISDQKRQKLTPEDLECVEYKLEQVEKMLPENVLKRNDSYSFYSRVENGNYLVKTGLTGTNVMDLHFIYIKRRNCECNFQRKVFKCDHDDEIIKDFNFLFRDDVNIDLKENVKD